MTLKTIITSAVTVLLSVGGILPVYDVLVTQEAKYQRVKAAEEADARLRLEIKMQKEKDDANRKKDSAALADIQETLATNKVDECAIVLSKRVASPMEQALCTQYDSIYKKAARSAREARSAAKAVEDKL